MNKQQLGSGELRMNKAFLAYEKKRLAKLDEEVDDPILINKIKSNIEFFEKKVELLEKNM